MPHDPIDVSHVIAQCGCTATAANWYSTTFKMSENSIFINSLSIPQFSRQIDGLMFTNILKCYPGVRRTGRSRHTVQYNLHQIHLLVLLAHKHDRHPLGVGWNREEQMNVIHWPKPRWVCFLLCFQSYANIKWTTSSNTLLRSMGSSEASQIAFSKHCRPGLPFRSRSISNAVYMRLRVRSLLNVPSASYRSRCSMSEREKRFHKYIALGNATYCAWKL